MIVNFFSVKQTNKSHPIESLYADFGSNVPRYMPLEGGSGINYLFGIAGDVGAILHIVRRRGFEVNSIHEKTDRKILTYAFTQVVVDDALYNRDHQAGINYSRDSAGYCLVERMN